MYSKSVPIFISSILLLMIIFTATGSADTKAVNATEKVTGSNALTLTVYIQPVQAVNAGAKWRWKGENEIWSDWYNSGYTETEGLEGNSNNVIQFSDVNGWNKPGDVAVFITDQPVVVAREYNRPTGSLKVNIGPQEAVDEGAKWRWQETGGNWSNWLDSGFRDQTVPMDEYVSVEFKNIAGWVRPDSFQVRITENLPAYTRSYTSNKTKITVNIVPADITAGVTWNLYFLANGTRVDMYQDKASGESVQVNPGLTYYIELPYLQDYAKPEDIPVQPVVAIDNVVEAKYKQLKVGQLRLYGGKLSYAGNEFKALGQSTWAFLMEYIGESVKHYKFKGNLHGQFSPAVVQGSGQLKINYSVGAFDKILKALSDRTIFNGTMTLDADSLETVSTSNCQPIWSIIGVSYTNTYFKLTSDPFSIEQSGYGLLPLTFFDEPSKVKLKGLKTTQNDEYPQIVGDVVWLGADIYGLVKFAKTKAEIDTTTKTFKAEGFDCSIDPLIPSLKGDIIIEDGKLKKLAAELYDIGLGLGDEVPISIDRAAFSFENADDDDPLIKFEGEASVSVPKVDIKVGEVVVDGELDMEGKLRAAGSYTILGYTVGESESELLFKGPQQYIDSSIDVNTMIGPGFLPLIIEGAGQIFVQWKPSGLFNGWLMVGLWFPVPDWLDWLIKEDPYYISSTYVGVDENGFHFRFKLLGINLTLDVDPKWLHNSGDRNLKFANAITNTYDSASPAASNSTVNVPAGSETLLLAFQGNDAEPEVVITGPDGTVYDTRTDNGHQGSDFICGIDPVSKSAGFLINNPTAGKWKISLKNVDVCGKVTSHQINSNQKPEVITGDIDKDQGGKYKLSFEAYDQDDNAKVRLYFSRSSSNFNGALIGSMRERDGAASFNWTPDKKLTGSGYIFAEIDDGNNPVERAYFDDRIYLDTNQPAAPTFRKVAMSKDDIIFTLAKLDLEKIKHIRIYYSDNVKEKVLSNYHTVAASRRVKLSQPPFAAGRKYQFRLTALSKDGVESELSRRIKFKYKLKDGNNPPFISSTPEGNAQAGAEYTYKIKTSDYDGDSVSLSLKKAPEGMTLEGKTITWTPTDSQRGRKTVKIIASDGKGGEDIQKFRVNISSASETNAYALDTLNGQTVITVEKPGISADPSVQDQLKIEITSRFNGETIYATLRETSSNSNIYKGVVRFTPIKTSSEDANFEFLNKLDIAWTNPVTGEEKTITIKR